MFKFKTTKSYIKPIILLVGKSGSGKNYLCKILCLNSIPSYTTRLKRINEQDGIEHIFVDKNSYEDFKNKKQIIAFTNYCGNYYWTTVQQFNDKQYDVCIIDPYGIECIKDYEYFNGKLERKYKIVYLKVNIFRRIINMYKRGDNIINIIKRIIYDYKAFKDFEQQIKLQNNNTTNKIYVLRM